MWNKRAEASELKTRLILAGVTVIAMIVLGASKESAVRGAGMSPAPRERQVVTRVDPVYPAALRHSKSDEVVRLESWWRLMETSKLRKFSEAAQFSRRQA